MPFNFSVVGKRVRKATASFLAALMFSMPAFADIVGGNGNITRPDGNTTNINGGFVNGNNTINHFTDFTINGGHTVNQYFNTANAVNMVNSRININGIYNSFMNGAMGTGNVLFISPLGMAVGAGGILNVGSLQTIVPTQNAYNNMLGAYNAMASRYTSSTPDANSNINVADADAAGLNAYLTASDPSYIGKTLGDASVVVDGRITANGLVSIAAGSVELGNGAGADTKNISTLGAVSLIANTGDIVGGNNLAIDAGGNIVLEAKSGNIGSSGNALKANSGGTIQASASNGSVQLASVGKNATFHNVTAKNGVNLKTENSGKLTTTGTTSGSDVTLNSAADIETGNVIASTGSVSITSETGMSQTAGTSIVSNNGSTTVVNNTSNDINLNNITAKGLTVNNKGGSVKVKTGASPALNSTGTTTISAKNDIDQDGTGVALNSSGNVSLSTANGKIGSSQFKLNSDGTVNAQASTGIKISSPGKALKISNAKTTSGDVELMSETSNLSVADTVSTGNGSAKLTSNGSMSIKNVAATSGITMNSKTGIAQTAGGSISNTSNGIINISNSNSGDINLVKVSNQTGNITVTSSGTNGNVILNTSSTPVIKTSSGVINISANKNITQTGNNIALDSSGDINLTAGANIGDTQGILVKTGNVLNAQATGGNINLGSKTGNTTKLGAVSTNGTFKFDGGALELTNALSSGDITLSNLDSLNTAGYALTSTGNILLDTITSAVLNDVTASSNVTLNKINILASNGTVQGQNVTLSNLGTASLNTVKAIAADGTVSIGSTGAVTLNNLIKGKTVTFNTGSIIADSANALINADTINLTSSGSIGSATNALKLTSDSSALIVTAKGNTDAYLSSNKNTTYNNVSAANNVSLKTTVGTLTTTGTTKGAAVKVDSAADAVLGQIESTGTLDINAVSGISQTANTKISSTNKTTIKNTTSNNIALKNAEAGSFEITNSGGDVVINSAGGTAITSRGIATITGKNILQSGQGKAVASTGAISLNATNGSIKNQAAGAVPDKNSTFKVSGGNVSAAATGDAFLSAALNGSNYGNDLIVDNVSAGNVYLGGTNVTLNGAAISGKLIANADNTFTTNTNITTVSGMDIDANSLSLNNHSLTNTTSGDINVFAKNASNIYGVTNSNGAINIGNGNGSYTLNGIVNGKNVNVNTTGSLLSANAGEIIASDNINLTAGSIGTAAKALDVSATSGNITATTNTGMNLNSKTSTSRFGALKNNTSGDIKVTAAGDATFAAVTNKNGNVVIGNDTTTGSYALNGLIDSKNVTVATKGSLSTNLDSEVIKSSGNVILKALQGNIGASKALNITTIGNVSAEAQSGVALKSGSTLNLLKAKTSAGNINIATDSGNITLASSADVSSTSGDVILDAANNLILGGTVAGNTVNLTGANITSPNVSINAATVNMTADTGAIGTDSSALNIATTANINANAKNGINILNKNKNLNISNAVTDTGNVKLATQTAGKITVTNAQAKAGSVVINSAADAEIKDVKATNGIDIDTKTGLTQTAGGAIASTGGSVSIDNATSGNIALKNVSNKGNITVNNKAASGDIVLETNASTPVLKTDTSGDITLTSGRDVLQNGTGTAVDSVKNIIFNAKGDVKNSDGSSLVVDSGEKVSVTGAKNFKLKAANGTLNLGKINVTEEFDYTGSDLTLNDDLTAGSINIHDINTLLQNSGTITASTGNAIFSNIVNATLNNVTASNGTINVDGVTALTSNGTLKANDITFENVGTASLNKVLATNNINLRTTGNITLNDLVKGLGVTFDSGDIIANSANALINANSVSLTSSGSIGTDVNNIKVTSDTSNLTVTAKAADNIYLSSNKNTTFNNVEGGNVVDLKTTTANNKLTTTGIVKGGSVKIDSKGTLEAGDIQSTNGDVTISASGAISQTAGKTITSKENTSITSSTDKVSLQNISAGKNLTVTAKKGIAQTSGTLIDVKGDLKATNIAGGSGDIVIAGVNTVNADITNNTGNVIFNDLLNATGNVAVVGSNITSTAANAINAVDLTLTARNAIGSASQALNFASTGNVTATAAKVINLNSTGADFNLASAKTTGAGDIIISTNAANGNITVDEVIAANGNVDIHNASNGGLIKINDDALTVNAGKTLTVTAMDGANSGVLFTTASNLTNNGTVTIANTGSKGTVIDGVINNNKTGDTKGIINVNNSKGDLKVAKTTQINNKGEIFLNNLENSGKLDILSTAIKNQTPDSVFIANNKGSGGLNFDKDAVTENYGSLELINGNGHFVMDGTINMHSGSNNTFTDATDNDFVIKSNIDNDGNNITFAQTGGGNLVIAEGTDITNKNSGTINLKNTTGGGIEVKENSTIKNNTNSTVNITNESTTGGINIDGKITADAGSKNNKVNIVNKGTDINVNNNTSITNISDLKITNTAESTGNLNILGALENNGNITLENLNYGNTQVNIGNNKIHTTGLLTMTNNGQNGLTVDGKQISSEGGIKLTSINSVTVNGKLVNDESANTDTNSHKGIVIINNYEDGHTTNNTGITINGIISSNAKNNQIINNNTHADSGIFINDTADGAPAVTTNGGIEITSKGGKGVVLDGKVLNSLNGITTDLGGDIKITSEKTGIDIIHYDTNTYDTDVRIRNEIGGINITAKEIKNSTGKTGVGLIAKGNISLNATGGSVGEYDTAIDNVKQDGYKNPDGSSRLDDTLSINVLTGGKINASSMNGGNGVVNVRSYGLDNALNTTNDMKIGNINTDGIAILPSVNGSLTADTVAAKDAYIYAGKADDGTINVSNAVISGLLRAESDGNITIASKNAGQKMDVDYIFSKNGDISLDINGNANIDSITSPGTIKVVSHGKKLHFDSLGKFDAERAKDIIPSVLNLTVTDAVSGSKNGLLDISNAYVRDKVIMKADNIHAQETVDKTNGVSNGHGFHTANKKGQKVTFDIQGYNHQQYSTLSPITDFGNPNYHPDPSDRRVLDLKLTIGEPVEGIFGAQFDKVYSDNAYINATEVRDPLTNQRIPADFNFKNITVNQKGRLHNNKYTVDINNVDKNYDYNADATLYTKKTGSFRIDMSEDLTIDTTAPIVVYNPNRIFNLPHTENSFQRLTNKSNSIEKETALERWHDKKKNTRSAKERKDIRWTIANGDQKILGSSTSESNSAITDILDISKGGMLVATNNRLNKGEMLNVNFLYKGIPFDVQGEVVRVDNDNTAGVKFINVDRFTSNVILYMTMMSESL